VKLASCVLALVGLVCIALAATADDDEEAIRAKWRHLFDRVAADYKLACPSEKQELRLVDRATYTWARSGAYGGTYGSVYVWTNRGNAEAVACFWRDPHTNGRVSVVHELHSLSPVVLQSTGKESDSWKPKGGLKRQPLAEAPKPAASATGRLQQMRTICRDFAGHSVGSAGDRTELRLLPQPLYRYQSTNPDIVDGALFAFVCSVGTDPEAFLQLEAINTPEGPRWHFTAARFSHMDLFVSYREREVWQAIRDQENTIAYNADHTYWVYHRPFDATMLDAAEDSK
jgi:hypothetical protein